MKPIIFGGQTWDGDPNKCARNGGLGLCNMGSGSHTICALGGIGCDVNHIIIARRWLADIDAYQRARANLESVVGGAENL